jgi:hypothetical protein
MPTAQSATQHGSTFANWAWLFPLTYVLHIAEEYWGGESFPRWISRVADVHLAANDFLILNGIGLALMTAGILLVSRWAVWRWTLTAFGGVVLLNGASHAIASIITRSYSPGLVTGLLCWVPLGVITLRHEWRNAARPTFRTGTLSAIGLHTLIFFLVLDT